MVYLDKEMCYAVKLKPNKNPQDHHFHGWYTPSPMQAAKLEEITSTKSLNGVA